MSGRIAVALGAGYDGICFDEIDPVANVANAYNAALAKQVHDADGTVVMRTGGTRPRARRFESGIPLQTTARCARARVPLTSPVRIRSASNLLRRTRGPASPSSATRAYHSSRDRTQATYVDAQERPDGAPIM
jgi:hypothetical protein